MFENIQSLIVGQVGGITAGADGIFDWVQKLGATAILIVFIYQIVKAFGKDGGGLKRLPIIVILGSFAYVLIQNPKMLTDLASSIMNSFLNNGGLN
ncbi:hypothetical protein ACVTYA_05735 [Enterococcus hirae]